MKATIFLTSLALLGLGAYLAYLDKTASSGVSFAAAIICMIFVSLEEFQKFKGFGIEAELREKIKEADDTIQRLRSFAIPTAEMLSTIAIRMGRWGSALSRQERYQFMKQIDEELKRIGVSAEDIEKSKANWHRYTIFDLGRPIFSEIKDRLESKIQEKDKALSAIPQPINAGDQNHKRLVEERGEIFKELKKLESLFSIEKSEELPRVIKNYIETCQLLTDDDRKHIYKERHEELEDLTHYASHKEVRRLDTWLKET